MSLYTKKFEEEILSKRIIDIEDRIVKAGSYVNSITEDCFEGTITKENGEIIADDPISSADEIIKVAKEIKDLAIQYKTLTDFENDFMDGNKKAVDSENANSDTNND